LIGIFTIDSVTVVEYHGCAVAQKMQASTGLHFLCVIGFLVINVMFFLDIEDYIALIVFVSSAAAFLTLQVLISADCCVPAGHELKCSYLSIGLEAVLVLTPICQAIIWCVANADVTDLDSDWAFVVIPGALAILYMLFQWCSNVRGTDKHLINQPGLMASRFRRGGAAELVAFNDGLAPAGCPNGCPPDQHRPFLSYFHMPDPVEVD